jgi:hypothetical protein
MDYINILCAIDAHDRAKFAKSLEGDGEDILEMSGKISEEIKHEADRGGFCLIYDLRSDHYAQLFETHIAPWLQRLGYETSTNYYTNSANGRGGRHAYIYWENVPDEIEVS